jgi:hypothetical protein
MVLGEPKAHEWLVPKLQLGNALGRQAPAWRDSGGPGAIPGSGEAGASPDNWVPKLGLGNQMRGGAWEPELVGLSSHNGA